MWTKVFISLYALMLVLSPAIRLPGVSGMRGITGDQVFLILLLGSSWLFWPQRFAKAIHAMLAPRTFIGWGYLILVLIALLTAAARLIFDASANAPICEVARLYGLIRPTLIILLAALLYRSLGKGQDVDLYEQFVISLLIFGALSIFLGVAQGMGTGWAVDFLSTSYTRDADFEDVLTYGRAYGTFDGQPNVFGTFCGLYILFLLNRMTSLTSLLVLAPLIIGAGLGLLFSGSRGALLALLISIAVWALLSRNLFGFLAIAVGGLSAVVIVSIGSDLVPPALINRLAEAVGLQDSTSGGLANTRLPYWTQIINLLIDVPLRLIWGIPCYLMPPPDSLQLALTAALGLPGLIVFITFLVIMWLRQFRACGPHSIEFLACLLFLMLNGTSYPTFLNARIGDLFWMIATLLFLSRSHGGIKCVSSK